MTVAGALGLIALLQTTLGGAAPTSGVWTRPSAAPPRTPIKRVEVNEPIVAITFDACATRTHASGFDRAVFEILRAEKVPSTIFVSGRWVESHPAVMGELSTEPLIEFGDHSYDHPHMRPLTAAHIAAQVDQTALALANYGRRPVAFRPPFGEWSHRVLQVMHQRQLPTVLWDVVSGDPSAQVTADAMVKTVLRQTKPGSIIIFHINGRGVKTAEALPVILRELRARGLRFVWLSTLLAHQAAPPPPASLATGEGAPPPARVDQPLPLSPDHTQRPLGP